MKQKIIKLFFTLKHLKFIQVYYQIWNRVKNKLIAYLFFPKKYKSAFPVKWKNVIYNFETYKGDFKFCFLNLEHHFKDTIDWNYSAYGKLWTYNLNYFDFLNQPNITTAQGLKLIKDYVQKDALIKDGKEPYPISLRGINWVKFLSQNNVDDLEINKTLYNHYQVLLYKLEYHLLANHLLENGFSLLFGAYYFRDEKLYKRASRIIKSELKEQILKDGGHFELSPMYHQIILHRLLDSIQLLQTNGWKQDKLLPLFKEKAAIMLAWLKNVTFANGNIPMVNDSAFNIAQSSEALFLYAEQLGVKTTNLKLSDSGYRKMVKNNFEIFLDVGDIKPDYQPGHSHADTFNFELYYNTNPIIVDKGVSTYEKNNKRQQERSTKSHNTVTINGENSSNIWSGFRVAQRAKATITTDNELKVAAHHNGYLKTHKTTHCRDFDFLENELKITDTIQNTTGEARFHFHNKVKDISLDKNSILLQTENLMFKFKAEHLQIHIEDYQLPIGFNKTTNAKCIVVAFSQKLDTSIKPLT